MTKKTLQLLASVALVAGMGMASVTTAHAADSTTGTAETTGNVTLTADDGEEGGNNAGGIVLKEAPWITMPSTEINGEDQTVAATVDASKNGGGNDGKLQVVNAGHKSNWNVQVGATAFASGDDTLGASTLTLSGGKVASVGTSTLPSSVSTALTFNGGSVTPNQDVVGATYNANTKEGVGTFDTTYTGGQLDLKAGNVAGAYESTITWTLTNTPQ